MRRLRANADSELVVEAFPRSANTTSMYALFYAQGKTFRVGHHLHVPAHVRYAVKHGIPCIVIMREPLDCIASLMVMREGGQPKELLKDYIDFAYVVQKLSRDIVIVDFAEVAANGIASAIERANGRFGTHFALPTNSPEEVQWVKQQILQWNKEHSGGDATKLSFPTDEKKIKAEKMKRVIEQHESLLTTARNLYLSLTEKT